MSPMVDKPNRWST